MYVKLNCCEGLKSSCWLHDKQSGQGNIFKLQVADSLLVNQCQNPAPRTIEFAIST